MLSAAAEVEKQQPPPLSTPRAGMFPILRSPLELYFQWMFNVVPMWDRTIN